MNRRNFISSLIGGLAATAAVRTWPFRVYSFPSEVSIPTFDEMMLIALRKVSADIDRDFLLNGIGISASTLGLLE